MANITEKIERQITALEGKIDALSGNYLTNTWKRQREQQERDRKKEMYHSQIQVLQFLKQKSETDTLTLLEQNLTVAAFYEDMRCFSASKKYCKDNPYCKFQYPKPDDVRTKRLQKAGITDTDELAAAVECFDTLLQSAVIPPDPNAIRLRDMLYRAKMYQKGDIQFTPPELAKELVALAGVRKDSRVLEPEAGIGNIADAAKEVTDHVITTPLAKNGSSVPAPTGFYPTLHPYRLQQVIQKIKPANIWVCHSGDLFGEWIPTEWILQVFEAAKQAPWHNYMFLTMNPNRYEELLETGVLMPTDNFWYGTRLTERGNVFTADGYHTFLCIEPMRLFAERMEIPNVEWILLGGYGKLKRSWIESVMERKGNIPVFMIGSKLFKDVWRAPLIQEYPPLLYRPAEKTLPHCSECKYCYSVRQGKRGLWRACRHYKIVRQDKDSGGRHIPGRYAAVSPQWCPKRPETNWRFTKRV